MLLTLTLTKAVRTASNNDEDDSSGNDGYLKGWFDELAEQGGATDVEYEDAYMCDRPSEGRLVSYKEASTIDGLDDSDAEDWSKQWAAAPKDDDPSWDRKTPPKDQLTAAFLAHTRCDVLIKRLEYFFDSFSTRYCPKPFREYLQGQGLERVFVMRLLYAWRYSAYEVLDRVREDAVERARASGPAKRLIDIDNEKETDVDLEIEMAQLEASLMTPMDSVLVQSMIDRCAFYFDELEDEQEICNYTHYQMFRRLFITPLLILNKYVSTMRGRVLSVYQYFGLVQRKCRYSNMRLQPKANVRLNWSLAHRTSSEVSRPQVGPVSRGGRPFAADEGLRVPDFVGASIHDEGSSSVSTHSPFSSEDDDNVNDDKDDNEDKDDGFAHLFGQSCKVKATIVFEDTVTGRVFEDIDDIRDASCFPFLRLRSSVSLNDMAIGIFHDYHELELDPRFFTFGEPLSLAALHQAKNCEDISDEEGPPFDDGQHLLPSSRAIVLYGSESWSVTGILSSLLHLLNPLSLLSLVYSSIFSSKR